jgi:hypothetical protein
LFLTDFLIFIKNDLEICWTNMLLVFRSIIVLLACLIFANSSAFAENTALEELNSIINQNVRKHDNNQKIDDKKVFNKDHWAYKVLSDICANHKLVFSSSDNNKDFITREEAALLLINVIEKSDNELSDKEKTQIDILKQELKSEIQCVFNRVTALEADVDSLKGSVAQLDESDKKSIKFNFGDKLNIQPFSQILYAGIINKNADLFPANFSLPLSGLNISGRLKPHLFYYTQIAPSIPFDSPLKNALSLAFAGTDIIPHNLVILGKFPVLIGAEAARTSLNLDTVNRAQISRNFGSIDTGLQAIGKTKYLSYYVSAFNGAGTDIINSSEELLLQPSVGRTINFGERFVVRPFGYNDKLGTIELGSGFFTGKKSINNNNVSYNLISYYTGYKRKKYELTAEYAQKEGFLRSGQFAYGWYIDNSYFLTNKLQLVARYDTFDPNKSIPNNMITEYTLGSNYLFSGINIKLQLDYVYVNREQAQNSQRILFLTQYVF